MKASMRRQLAFASLREVISECESLLASGYTRHGKWTLGQICCHLRVTIEANLNGYPAWMTVLGYPLRPLLKWFMLPRLLAGNSPAGIKTAGRFVPAAGLDDRSEVKALSDCIDLFEAYNKPLHAHPGFGRMTKAQFDRFHAAHAAHHLGFLSPADSE